MDCQLSCISSLPQIWAIETLASSNEVDLSLLLDLLEKTPEVSDNIGRNARELVSLRILESFFIQGARANPVSSALSQTIRLDPSDHCEDVLRRILSETSPSHLKPAAPEMSKWDLKPFTEHKRSSLPKYALKQLKDAILTGSHSFFASLKEQSGLPVGNQAEHEAPVKDGNCNGITPRIEGSDTNDSFHLPRDLPDETLLPVNRKRRATSESAAETTSKSAAEKLCPTHINSVKKYKHDIICSEQYAGGKLISSGVDRQLADAADISTVSVQHIEGERCGFGRKTHIGSMRLNESPKDDNNECTSSKGLVGPEEILPRGKQVTHCDTELINKSEEEQGQDQNIEEAKGDKKGFCDLRRTNEDVDKFEQNIQNVGEVEEHVHISNNNDGIDDDRTDISRKETASLGPQCTYNQDSLTTTNFRDQNLLAGTSKRYSEEERSCLEKKTSVDVIRQNRPPQDGNNQCPSSKGLVGNDEVLPHEKQALHCGTEVSNDKFDEERQDSEGENAENGRKGFHGLITSNEVMDKFEQNVFRNVPTVGEAEEDVDISSDNDGYHDERTNIDTKKKTFLSSQCTYSQDSLATTDWRELHLCVKCNKGGKLLSCSSDSCPLVIHENCLGSEASFDTRGEFYCPFCAYSQAISKYMEIKKKVCLARKDLETFICMGARQESRKQSQRSFRIEENHLKQDDTLPKSNELNKEAVVEKVSNRQHRKKLEYEQAGPSELHSGYSPPFEGKAVDSTNRVAQTLNKDKQDGKRRRQVSQSLRVHGQQQIAAQAIRNSQGENTSCQISETSGSEKHADIRSKNGVLCPPETDLPRECKCSRGSQSADAEEISEEENENSGASKYFIRVRKQEKQKSYPAIPQLRRKRLPWTSEEEDTLKDGMRLFCSPHDKIIPWKKILEFGAGKFHPSRSTMDLKDKWRNMCKATPKSK